MSPAPMSTLAPASATCAAGASPVEGLLKPEVAAIAAKTESESQPTRETFPVYQFALDHEFPLLLRLVMALECKSEAYRYGRSGLSVATMVTLVPDDYPDPQATAHSAMPSSWGFPIEVYPRHVCNPSTPTSSGKISGTWRPAAELSRAVSEASPAYAAVVPFSASPIRQ